MDCDSGSHTDARATTGAPEICAWEITAEVPLPAAPAPWRLQVHLVWWVYAAVASPAAPGSIRTSILPERAPPTLCAGEPLSALCRKGRSCLLLG